MPEERFSWSGLVAIGILIALIGIGSIILLSTRPEPVQITINPPVPTGTLLPTVTSEPIVVYVTGAVESPETTVKLPKDSRVQDALDAVGGVTDEADLTSINLAGILYDGDQIHVPLLIDRVDDNPTIATPTGGGLVFVNRATAEELEELPGVGPVLAERIVAYRDENGDFANLTELGEVEGIGFGLLDDWDGLISFD